MQIFSVLGGVSSLLQPTFFFFFLFACLMGKFNGKFAKLQGEMSQQGDKTLNYLSRLLFGASWKFHLVVNHWNCKEEKNNNNLKCICEAHLIARKQKTKYSSCSSLHSSVILLIIRNPKEHSWHKGGAICVAMWETWFDTGPDSSPHATTTHTHTQQPLRDYRHYASNTAHSFAASGLKTSC